MILIGMGANLPGPHGAPPATLLAAARALEARGLRVLAASQLWRSAPVPVSDQPWYYNTVVRVETALLVSALLHELQIVEQEFGRVRTARNAARILDLDLLAYNNELIGLPDLIVPHPRLAERAFVLLPLQEIAPSWAHPATGENVAAMIARLPEQQIEPAGEWR